jgi:excisionase family DNA binding protein
MGTSAQSSRRAYPVNEACYRLGIKRTLLYRLARQNKIKLIKIASRTLVPDTEIERLVHGVTRGPKAPTPPR